MNFTSLDGVPVDIDESVIEGFTKSLSGKALFQGDPAYDEARVIFNGLFDIKPAVIVQPHSANDVIKTVNFARENSILLAVKGGGHSVAGKCLAEGSITLDMRPMNEVLVDAPSMTASVGPGTLLGEMDSATQEHGLAVPAGIVSDTGVAGLTLGGGFGWIKGKYGLSIDNLLSVDIVTAHGEHVKASQSENEDLFWGVRGGSGNFGVVTNFTFQAHPVGPELLFTAPLYPIENAEHVITFWREFMDSSPDEYTSMLFLMNVPEAEAFPKELHGRQAVMIPGVYCGDIEDGIALTQPLREMDGLLLDLSGTKKYTEIQSFFDLPLPQGSFSCYFTSLYLNKFDEEMTDLLLDIFKSRPSTMIPYIIQDLRGQNMRVPADATAFGDRSAPYNLEINSAWTDSSETEHMITWTREAMNKFRPYSPGRGYLNHTGLNEEGEAMVKRTYGKNYERLRKIKKKYDPGNLFRVNQNISPAD